MEKTKTLKVLETEIVDAAPEAPNAFDAWRLVTAGAPTPPSPENETEVRDLLAAAIELYAEMVEVPCPGIHFGPERRFCDSKGTERTMVLRFGAHDFEVRILKSEASDEGI